MQFIPLAVPFNLRTLISFKFKDLWVLDTSGFDLDLKLMLLPLISFGSDPLILLYLAAWRDEFGRH